MVSSMAELAYCRAGRRDRGDACDTKSIPKGGGQRTQIMIHVWVMCVSVRL